LRNRGTRYELVRTRSHDHIGWVYSGVANFAELATQFLSPIKIELGDTSFITRSLLTRLVAMGSSGWDVVVRALQIVLDRFSQIEVAGSGAVRWEIAST
jgi:hypothetical protein